MASAACTSWHTRPYLGNWNTGTVTLNGTEGWYSNFNSSDSDGYCYKSGSSTTYAFCFSFKTPSGTNFYKSTSLAITLPIIRTGSGFAKSGTLYFKLLTSDPTGGTITSNLKPTKDTCDASCTWESNDQDPHKVSFTISSTSLKANTRYYVTVAGNKLIGIGWGGAKDSAKDCTPAKGWWAATLTYSTYTNVTANKPTITDNGNNTFTIQALAGSAGTNNAVNSTTLYYRIGDSGSYTKHSALTKSDSLTCAASVASQKVYAYTIVDGTCSDVQSDTAEAAVKNYQPPSQPGEPALSNNSFKNGRLTIKQDWTFTWTAATPGNNSDYNAIKGYRIRLYKNDINIPIKQANGSQLSTLYKIYNGVNDYIYDTESTATSLTIDPLVHEFNPGDMVHLGIYSYSKNGLNTQLFNGGGRGSAQVNSTKYLVQNAGVVNVKVNGSWVEGQVWVKANDEWHEAETVNVKTDSGWMESQ